MAKWGEGDPRWIVEERPDATNVNNWHWTEKNADAWSKKKLEELLVNFVIEDTKVGNVVIEEMEKCDGKEKLSSKCLMKPFNVNIGWHFVGEARVNNRKAKLIFFYEWELALKWKGHVNGKEKEITGKIEIPNLSEEHNDMKDVDVDITISNGKGSPEGEILKDMMRKGTGAKMIRTKLQEYVDALKKEYSEGLILPKKDEATKSSGPKVLNNFS